MAVCHVTEDLLKIVGKIILTNQDAESDQSNYFKVIRFTSSLEHLSKTVEFQSRC